MQQKYQIIYSVKVMTKLVERGFIPKETMKNPKYSKFDCWIFEVTPEFQSALKEVLGGISE